MHVIFNFHLIALSSALYEKLCVLFNLGACCSESAAAQPLDSDDSLKTAAKLYQLAAGAFAYIRDNSLTATRNDCTLDLFPETLTLLTSVMLAQAQEVFYLKCVKDRMKDLTLSKIVAQCADFYADAMKAVQHESLKELQKVSSLSPLCHFKKTNIRS